MNDAPMAPMVRVVGTLAATRELPYISSQVPGIASSASYLASTAVSTAPANKPGSRQRANLRTGVPLSASARIEAGLMTSTPPISAATTAASNQMLSQRAAKAGISDKAVAQTDHAHRDSGRAWNSEFRRRFHGVSNISKRRTGVRIDGNGIGREHIAFFRLAHVDTLSTLHCDSKYFVVQSELCLNRAHWQSVTDSSKSPVKLCSFTYCTHDVQRC